MATKKEKADEQKPEAASSDEAHNAAPESSGSTIVNEENTTEWLFKQYDQNRAAYRERAGVFRYTEGQPSKWAPWVGEIPCLDIKEAHKVIARMRWGGPGRYVVWLQDAHTGQKIKGKFANVTTEADLRDGADDMAGGAPAGGMAGIITSLAIALRPQKSDLEGLLLARALDGNDAQMTQMSSAYNRGFDDGVRRGQLLSGEAWKPTDIIAAMREVKEILRPTGAAGGKPDPQILEIFRMALDHGLSPSQLLRVLLLFLGRGVILGLFKNLEAIMGELAKDPEAAQLLTRPGAREWLVAFASELKQEAETEKK